MASAEVHPLGSAVAMNSTDPSTANVPQTVAEGLEWPPARKATDLQLDEDRKGGVFITIHAKGFSGNTVFAILCGIGFLVALVIPYRDWVMDETVVAVIETTLLVAGALVSALVVWNHLRGGETWHVNKEGIGRAGRGAHDLLYIATDDVTSIAIGDEPSCLYLGSETTSFNIGYWLDSRDLDDLKAVVALSLCGRVGEGS